jgi:hypothetical protein
MTPKRFLFGLLDDSGDLQGVYSSHAKDSSGVADESGVFLFKTNPDAAAGQHSVCVYLRQRGGQFDKKCVTDPENKLRLYSKCCWKFCKDFRDARADAARQAEHGDRSADLHSPIKPSVEWGQRIRWWCQMRDCGLGQYKLQL